MSRLDDGSDEVLIARVRAGEGGLFAVIMQRYERLLHRAARAIVDSDDEAEDVAQDAFVRAWAHLDQFRGSAHLGAWLRSIAVHEAMARERRRGRLRKWQDETAPLIAPERGPEQALAAREISERLRHAVHELPLPWRRALLLRAVEGLTTAETATVLEIPEETVKTHLFRARARLRRAVAV